MSVLHVRPRPAFGGPLQSKSYYDAVDSIIAVLRNTATLRVIALHLTTAGFTSPSGLPWTRERVAAYIHNTSKSI